MTTAPMSDVCETCKGLRSVSDDGSDCPDCGGTGQRPAAVSDADLDAFIAFVKPADIGPIMMTALAIAEDLKRRRDEQRGEWDATSLNETCDALEGMAFLFEEGKQDAIEDVAIDYLRDAAMRLRASHPLSDEAIEAVKIAAAHFRVPHDAHHADWKLASALETLLVPYTRMQP
jgi:hypothetical protein